MPCKLTLLLLSSLLLSINLFADEAGISPAAEQRLAAAKSRLDLSEEQATAMAPILKKNMQQANSVLESYGVDLKNQSGPKEKLGGPEARKLGEEMDKIRANTLEELTPILNEQQVLEYKKIQQENKAAIRERIMQDAGISPAARQRLAETKSRLDLSEEQATAMAPILKKNMQQANSVLESYGIDLKNQSGPKEKLGWRKARKLGKEMDKIRANTLEELTPILDEQQLVEYKKIQQENKAALRERIRQRRER